VVEFAAFRSVAKNTLIANASRFKRIDGKMALYGRRKPPVKRFIHDTPVVGRTTPATAAGQEVR
jgi:hypothetical protein